MKKYNYLLVLVLLACQPSAEKDPLLKEVITIHDEAMEEMGPVMSLKIKLKESIDSTRLTEYELAMTALDNAHENMMVWMRNFSKEFPNAALKGGAEHHGHHNMNHEDHEQHSRSPAQERELLETEKIKVTALRKEMAEAIKTAENLLNKHEN